MPQVSLARDIRPLFRDVDISHMEVHGIKLDDYAFMSDPDNADKVRETLSPPRRRPAFHAARRALLDSGPARVVRPVAERGLPALRACRNIGMGRVALGSGGTSSRKRQRRETPNDRQKLFESVFRGPFNNEQEKKTENINAKRRIVTDKSVWRDFNDR
jgi:hypothetical protein